MNGGMLVSASGPCVSSTQFSATSRTTSAKLIVTMTKYAPRTLNESLPISIAAEARDHDAEQEAERRPARARARRERPNKSTSKPREVSALDVGADAEERDVAEAELPGVAEQQVEAHRRDGENAGHDEGVQEVVVRRARAARESSASEPGDGERAPHPIRSARAKRPVGLNSSTTMMMQEAHRVPVAGGDVAGAELLGEREDEAADRRAGDVAEAAQDDDREGLQRGEVAHRRRRRRRRGRAARRRRRRGRADREGRGVDRRGR